MNYYNNFPTSRRIFKSLFFLMALLTSPMVFTSCGDNNATPKEGIEYTSAYICPMHCKGSGSATAGKCPVCKMDYVKNENYKGEQEPAGHDHDGHSHDGHNHDGHSH